MKEDQKSKKNGAPRKGKGNQSSADFLVLIKAEFFGNSKAAEFDEKKHFLLLIIIQIQPFLVFASTATVATGK